MIISYPIDTDDTAGDNGWTPIVAVVSDGARRVIQVTGWTGGSGSAPASGRYVGAAGLVTDIGDAVDIRGATGTTGAAGTNGTNGEDGSHGWSPTFVLASDGERRVLQVSGWSGGSGDEPPGTGYYVGAEALVDGIENGVDVRGGTGATGPAGPGFADCISDTSHLMTNTGDRTFVLAGDRLTSDYAFLQGQRVKVIATNDEWAEGALIINSSTSYRVLIDRTSGDTGTYSEWRFVLVGEQGDQGDPGLLSGEDYSWTASSGTADKTGQATYEAASISNPPTQAEVQAIADHVQHLSRRLKALTDALLAGNVPHA